MKREYSQIIGDKVMRAGMPHVELIWEMSGLDFDQ